MSDGKSLTAKSIPWLGKLWKSSGDEGPATTTILIVEDDPHIAHALQLNLEAEGYQAGIATDGPTALAQFEADKPPIDLVILDLMLPGMSGYSVCENLRSQGWDRPIVMLSARTLTEDRIRGYNVGADVYLQKPFDLEELLTVVRNLLQRFQSRPDRPAPANTASVPMLYRFGDAEINFDTHQVLVAEQEVRLTALELKLLRYFIEHQNSVVSRAAILEEVWGMQHIPNTRTVDNFIMNLRRTFEKDSANPKHFLSVRGTGYRFVPHPEPTSPVAPIAEFDDS
jgi:two-component system OmpR family response regulator